jgi:hypothetical protein
VPRMKGVALFISQADNGGERLSKFVEVLTGHGRNSAR